jgi:transposase
LKAIPTINELLTIISIQQKQIAELQRRVIQLEEELSRYKTKKDSNNSSIPPSRDENRPIRNKSLRGKSGKKVGGQKGHKGYTLEMTDTPDRVVEHIPCYCEKCGNGLQQVQYEYAGRRQVIDIPPIKPEVIEHRVYKKRCTCGHETISGFPGDVTVPVSYGCGVESLIGYFHTRQYIPFARMLEIFHDIFGLPVSEGGLHYLLNKLVAKAAPAYEMIKQTVYDSEVIGSDETGAKVNGKKQWFWTWQSKTATLISISSNRGFDTIQSNCGDAMGSAILVHDCWKPHFQAASSGHQLCTSHLLRELNYLMEKDKVKWPSDFKNMLMKALKLKKLLASNDYYYPNKKRDGLEKELEKLLRQKIENKFKETVSFQKRMNKYKNYIFTFLYHPKVPPDNNDSEKAIRNVKVKQKVSGQFRSIGGAQAFAILRSITDTALKNGQNVLNALNIVANMKIQTD